MIFLKLHYGIMSVWGALSSFQYGEKEKIPYNYSNKVSYHTPSLLQCYINSKTLANYGEIKLTLKIKSFFP